MSMVRYGIWQANRAGRAMPWFSEVPGSRTIAPRRQNNPTARSRQRGTPILRQGNMRNRRVRLFPTLRSMGL